MRWVSYFILAYIALGLQVGLAPHLRYQGAAPNLVLLAVIFIAINAPPEAALLGAFALGMLQDLLTQQQPGLFAFSYGLVGMFVVSTQQLVYREHPLTHLSLALIGGLMTAGILLIHGWIHPASPRLAEAHLSASRLSPRIEFARVIYTAVLSPFVLGVLQRSKRMFAFKPPRKRIRAW
jgi:rod shape-determining protein MreD